MLGGMADVTQILNAIEQGDPRAAAELLPLVYHELRKLAAAQMAREQPGQTLDATALVHEAYLRLVGPADEKRWENRSHFFGAAAEAMRRILVENARRRGRIKRGGGLQRVELNADQIALDMPAEHLLLLDEALNKLAHRDAQTARLVELHCFAGLSIEQAAATLGLSSRTAYRDWNFAQAWLYREIQGLEPAE